MEAEVVNFLEEAPTAAPSSASVFGSLEMQEPLSTGVWLHQDENYVLRYSTAAGTSDEVYVTAPEDDLPDQPHLLLTEVLGAQAATRRAPARGRRPSVCGVSVGSNAKALASLLSGKPLPSTTTSKAKPMPKAPAAAATTSPSGDREMMSQLLAAVTALGDRMSSLEAHQRSGAKAMAPPPMASASSAAPPGFMPAAAAPPVAKGAMCSPKMPSMIGAPPAPPGQQAGMNAYEQSLEEARRLLALPSTTGTAGAFREDSAPGGAVARERAADSSLRAAVLQGGADSQVAVNLAVLEVLERLQHGRKASDDDVFQDFLTGDAVDSNTKLEGRGAATLLRLSQAIERSPDRWVAKCNMAAQRALGCQDQQPWSMEWYGERCVNFRSEHLERMWSMLASLHGLLRRGETEMVAAKVCQYLKACELCSQCNGSWKIAWSLTALPEIKSMAARQVGVGLGHPAEYVAAIAWLKDQQTVEAALKKGAELPANPGAQGAGGQHAKPKSAQSRSGKGDGKSSKGSNEEPRASSQHSIKLNPHRAGAAASSYVPRSLLLGAYTTQGQGVSRATEHQWTREVLQLVHRLARLRPDEWGPLDYISVNLNQNPRLPAHRDKHNLSDTWLATGGGHTGGDLWIEAVGEEIERYKDALRPLPASLLGAAPPDTL
eukprot:6460829-Amphidinium_carterae.1